MTNPNAGLLAGAAEAEITPPIGTVLAGSLYPRPSEGVDDPLFVKALVLRLGETTVAQLSFDLVNVDAELAKRCAAEASAAGGITEDHIFCTATHTHSGPMVREFPKSMGQYVNTEWRESVPGKAAQAVASAMAALRPVRPTLTRAYAHGLSHYRRLEFKDGAHINTWLLNRGEEDRQCIGAAGPIDPELLAIAFEDDAGRVIATLVSYALHACSGGGSLHRISADYPGALTRCLREHFGEALICLFLPAAGGSLNPVLSRQEAGAAMAGHMRGRWDRRRPIDWSERGLGVRRSSIRLPLRKLDVDQSDKLRRSQWPEEHWAYFRESQQELIEGGVNEPDAPFGVWHLGDVAFATFPGEPFVELGMDLKRRSPFPWTIPVGYTQDSQGYLITPEAWQAGGYEALIARQGAVSPEGGQMIVDELVRMLTALRTPKP
jgi:hypothetical protein